MRLPDEAHDTRPWRIHEIAPDFRLEDVWDLVSLERPGDFERLVHVVASYDLSGSSSRAVRTLVAIREGLGEVFGWDAPDEGLGSRVPTVRDRLPADLRNAVSGPAFDAIPFQPLYLTPNEWAAEIANQTVHAILHLGCVPDGKGGHRARLAVLVKPNGFFGKAYMAAIKPFRHFVVYPALLREIEHAWRAANMPAAWDAQGESGARAATGKDTDASLPHGSAAGE